MATDTKTLPSLPPNMQFDPDPDPPDPHTTTGYEVWELRPDGDRVFKINSVYCKTVEAQADLAWELWGVSRERWEALQALDAENAVLRGMLVVEHNPCNRTHCKVCQMLDEGLR